MVLQDVKRRGQLPLLIVHRFDHSFFLLPVANLAYHVSVASGREKEYIRQ